MFALRPYKNLGGAHHGWLDTKHHFSFADYHDPQRMSWGQLRVLNDDTIAPHTGFAAHPHKDMEIITYVRQGAISHKDSLGHSGRTETGEVQVMTAGTGIVHSEYNHEDIPTKIFQIWLMPAQVGLTPRWSSRPFPQAANASALIPLASGRNPQPDALTLNADAEIFGAALDAGASVQHALEPDRFYYLVLATGHLRVGSIDVHVGDGLAIHHERSLTLDAVAPSHLLLIDAAPY